VRVSTLRGAVEAGAVAGRVDLPAGSWGAGKDWHVWAGEQVRDLAEATSAINDRLLHTLDKTLASRPAAERHADLDQLVREAFLATSSDWAFMVSHDSAAAYARARAGEHARAVHDLADRLDAGRPADRLAARLREVDGPFGHLDARALGLRPG